MWSPLTAYHWSLCLAFGQARQVMGTAASLHTPPSELLAPVFSLHNLWLPVCARLSTEVQLADEGSPSGSSAVRVMAAAGSHTPVCTLDLEPFQKKETQRWIPHTFPVSWFFRHLYCSVSISKTNETIRTSHSQCNCEFDNVLIQASRNAWSFLLWEQSGLPEMDLFALFC